MSKGAALTPRSRACSLLLAYASGERRLPLLLLILLLLSGGNMERKSVVGSSCCKSICRHAPCPCRLRDDRRCHLELGPAQEDEQEGSAIQRA